MSAHAIACSVIARPSLMLVLLIASIKAVFASSIPVIAGLHLRELGRNRRVRDRDLRNERHFLNPGQLLKGHLVKGFRLQREAVLLGPA